MYIALIVFDGTEVGGNTQPVAVIETDFGKIVFRFYFSDAPKHCENFITLAKKGFYNNLTFHRIVRGFVIQGGCPKGDGTGDPGYKIKAEFNSRKHVLGAVAMARAQDPDSAGCQFYICLTDQPNLDGKYTVFGQVIEGIDVVKKIGEVPVGRNDRPNTPVVMKKITIEERKVPK
jgi:peptidyl-prolyl cis-trans isomerase B (cyclophilin B)